nr:serine hydrolase [Legionella jordanis]
MSFAKLLFDKSRAPFIFLLLIFLALTGFTAETTTEQKIDQLIQTYMKQHAIPGLALAVIMNGKLFILKGYGYGNVQTHKPVTTQTLFALGSISKVLTAFAVMKLVQEDKIHLDDSILTYIPDAPPSWQEVNISQLMSHSSGIPQYHGPHLPWQQLWETMAAKAMQFSPGTSVRYNNFAYIVLGRVIEKVSQQSLENYLQYSMFKPLNMMQTGFPVLLFPSGLASGYRSREGSILPNANQTPWLQMWGSGGIVSNIIDMAKWDMAITAEELLSPSSYRRMWMPVFLKNGQPAGHKDWAWSLGGWQVSYRHGKLVAFKNGAIRGYSSWMVRHIDDHLSIILLTNSNKVPLQRIAEQI